MKTIRFLLLVKHFYLARKVNLLFCCVTLKRAGTGNDNIYIYIYIYYIYIYIYIYIYHNNIWIDWWIDAKDKSIYKYMHVQAEELFLFLSLSNTYSTVYAQ